MLVKAQRPSLDLSLTRPTRVCVLLSAVVLLSVGDLVMTLTYLTNVGMSESNPIARHVMGYQSPGLLVVWKLASVCAACGILYIHRHRRQAEIGSWICLAVLVWLTFRWASYAGAIDVASLAEAAAIQRSDPDWISMTR